MPMSKEEFERVYGYAWHVGAKEISTRHFYVENAGTPASAITPDFIGQWCFDTVGEDFYLATGLTDADWKQVTA